MAGGKGKSSGGKSSGGKTSAAEGPKKQQSHSARAGLQVCRSDHDASLFVILFSVADISNDISITRWSHNIPRFRSAQLSRSTLWPLRRKYPAMRVLEQHCALDATIFRQEFDACSMILAPQRP